jgi:hypothetical protein
MIPALAIAAAVGLATIATVRGVCYIARVTMMGV